jgi:alpha-glucosidase
MARARLLVGAALFAAPAASQTWTLGAWLINLSLDPSTTLVQRISFIHNGTLVLASPLGRGLLSTISVSSAPVRLRECFDLRNETAGAACEDQRVDSAALVAPGALQLNGTLCGGGAAYTLTLAADERDGRALAWRADVVGAAPPGAALRVWLGFELPAPAEVFGLGEQYSFLSAAGQRVPLFVREQGLGRGLQPWTWLVNTFAPGQCGGDAATTYTHVPWLVSAAGTGLYVDTREYAVFDLTNASTMGHLRVEVNASGAAGFLLAAPSPLAAVQAYTALVAGRMVPLPPYLAAGGAVIGLEGGGSSVRARLEAFFKAHPEVPVKAVWIQDWVGLYNRSIDGQQSLMWSWQWNTAHYPNASGFVAELAARGVRTWGYINPFLQNCSAALAPGAQDLFGEALAGGFTVNSTETGTQRVYDGDTALLDLTSPGARSFVKALIRENMLTQGLSGFMADFGEALPLAAVRVANESFDAPRARGLPALHNAWPRLWSDLVAEAIAEAAAAGAIPSADDIVFFSRSAEASSPARLRLMWLGDQLTTWDSFDGLRSAVTGLVSSSFSGFALSHSDIGGYTSLDGAALGLPNVNITRSKALFCRWAEHAAFTVLYRTHPGADVSRDWQFDSDADTAALFARMARVHAAWAPYRTELMARAAAEGSPVVRAAALAPAGYFAPGDAFALRISDQYLLGTELLVAPVLDEGAAGREVLLPAGAWVHVWSGAVAFAPAGGRNASVAAPLGFPPVFFPQGSAEGGAFVAALNRSGLLPGAVLARAAWGVGWPAPAPG